MGNVFEFSKQNSPEELLMATGAPGPLFDKAYLSLNDNISLTQPCYIQIFWQKLSFEHALCSKFIGTY